MLDLQYVIIYAIWYRTTCARKRAGNHRPSLVPSVKHTMCNHTIRVSISTKPGVVTRKPFPALRGLANDTHDQFVHYHVCSRWLLAIDRSSLMSTVHRVPMMVYGSMRVKVVWTKHDITVQTFETSVLYNVNIHAIAMIIRYLEGCEIHLYSTCQVCFL